MHSSAHFVPVQNLYTKCVQNGLDCGFNLSRITDPVDNYILYTQVFQRSVHGFSHTFVRNLTVFKGWLSTFSAGPIKTITKLIKGY